jgi:hypothetical protein
MGLKLERQLIDIWYSLFAKFKRKKEPIDFNFKKTVVEYIGKSDSNNYTHYIHSYPGKIFLYIPTFILSIPEVCGLEGIVLDPFCGSGTVLLESIVHPLYKRDALGIEINPMGRLIAKVKTTAIDSDELTQATNDLLRKAEQLQNIETSAPKFRNIDFWFSTKAKKRLAKLRSLIDEQKNDDIKDFFYVCFSSIVRKVSNADPFIPPPVKLTIQKYENSAKKLGHLERFLKQVERAEVLSLFENKVKVNSKRLESLSKVEGIRKGKVKAQVIWDDARCMKMSKMDNKAKFPRENVKLLPSKSIDLVLTSPPYLTAQKYLRTQKLELFWLNLLSEEEFRCMDRDIIGSEHVSLKNVDLDENLGVQAIDSLIKWASTVSLKRAANLFKYFFDMKQALSEMYRVLRSDGYAIIVVGNNRVLGKYVETYKLLTDLAISVGFRPDLILKDKIRGRGMITKRHNSGGLIKEEFVLILSK